MERRQQRPFVTLNELNQLKGAPRNFVTKDRESLLTVWGDGKVNINTAPRAVLASLGMDEEHIKKIEEFRKGAGGPADMGAFKTLGDARPYLGGIDDKWLTTASSTSRSPRRATWWTTPAIKCKLRQVVQRGPDGLQVLRFEQLPFERVVRVRTDLQHGRDEWPERRKATIRNSRGKPGSRGPPCEAVQDA